MEAVRSRFRFYDRPRGLTSMGGRLAWGMWNWGYNQLAKRFGADILEPLDPARQWKWDAGKCKPCKLCVEACPVHVLRLEEGRLLRDKDGCIYCYCCVEACPQGAISRF